ncbi:MAG: 6-phosphogluconolactonase [Burkholderia gladioli]|nr:MAG: 6-phosphogluconolactonase [Burkholderia gladioli]
MTPLRLGHWIKGIAVVLSLSAAHAFAQDTANAPNDAVYNLLVGTYTGAGSEGIYVYRFNTRTGDVSQVVSTAKTVKPYYLLPSRDGRFVYAVNELPGDDGPASQRGGVSAFAFYAKSGTLNFLDRVSSEGNDPCYLSLSPDGKYLVTANYSGAADPGGSFTVFPVESDGKVGASALNGHHEGGGPVKGRQDGAALLHKSSVGMQ